VAYVAGQRNNDGATSLTAASLFFTS